MATVLGSTGVKNLKNPVKTYNLRDRGFDKTTMVVFPCTSPPTPLMAIDTDTVHNIVVSSDSQLYAKVSGVAHLITVKHMMHNNTTVQPELALVNDTGVVTWLPVLTVLPYKIQKDDTLFTFTIDAAMQGVVLNGLIVR